MEIQPAAPVPVQGRSGALLYVVSSVTVAILSLSLQYQGRTHTVPGYGNCPLPQESVTFSNSVGTDCVYGLRVCYGAQCCGYNGYCNALVQKTSHIISQQLFEAVNAIQTLKISARTTTFMWHSQCECVAVKRSVVVQILRSMVQAVRNQCKAANRNACVVEG